MPDYEKMEKRGSFKARAAAAKKDPNEFAEMHAGDKDSTTGKLARLFHAREAPGVSGKAPLDGAGDTGKKRRNPLYQAG